MPGLRAAVLLAQASTHLWHGRHEDVHCVPLKADYRPDATLPSVFTSSRASTPMCISHRRYSALRTAHSAYPVWRDSGLNRRQRDLRRYQLAQ
jgi:hypothetical protein